MKSATIQVIGKTPYRKAAVEAAIKTAIASAGLKFSVSDTPEWALMEVPADGATIRASHAALLDAIGTARAGFPSSWQIVIVTKAKRGEAVNGDVPDHFDVRVG
jgi:hypothetical protein